MNGQVFVVLLDTRHFSFVAVGRTRNEAFLAMKRGWEKHVKEFPGALPFVEFEDGLEVLQVPFGACMRDGEVV